MKKMVYQIEDLRKEYLAGKKFKFLFFYGHTPSKDNQITETCFSQWWMASFIVDGVYYSCAEQYMMAEKARMFEDKEMLEAILKAKHPKEMKAYGRAVKNFDQKKWESSCYEIVKKGNMEKFSQNLELKEYLLGTQNRILVEASPRDRIWGIGMGKQNPDAENPIKWRGKNLLGFALTEVRDSIFEKIDLKKS